MGNAHNRLLAPCIGHNQILQIIAKVRNHTLQRVISQMNPMVFRIYEILHIDSHPSSLLLSHLKDIESFNTQQHSSHRYRIRKCYERQLISGLEILALLYQKRHCDFRKLLMLMSNMVFYGNLPDSILLSIHFAPFSRRRIEVILEAPALLPSACLIIYIDVLINSLNCYDSIIKMESSD
jgi:hypothetical protein